MTYSPGQLLEKTILFYHASLSQKFINERDAKKESSLIIGLQNQKIKELKWLRKIGHENGQK